MPHLFRHIPRIEFFHSFLAVAMFSLSVTQHAHAQTSVVGNWGTKSSGSVTELELSSNGTYHFLVAVRFNGVCRGREFRGTYSISGQTIDFVPSSGEQVDCVSSRPFAPAELSTEAKQRPNIGIGKVNASLRGNMLCIEVRGSDSCYRKY